MDDETHELFKKAKKKGQTQAPLKFHALAAACTFFN